MVLCIQELFSAVLELLSSIQELLSAVQELLFSGYRVWRVLNQELDHDF